MQCKCKRSSTVVCYCAYLLTVCNNTELEVFERSLIEKIEFGDENMLRLYQDNISRRRFLTCKEGYRLAAELQGFLT